MLNTKYLLNNMSTSLYIPVIFDLKCDEDFIKKTFNEKNIGEVNHVDFVFNKNKKRLEAFVHFSMWFDTQESITIQESLADNAKQTKLYYVKDKFWPLLINNNPTKKVANPNYTNIEHVKDTDNTIIQDLIKCNEALIKKVNMLEHENKVSSGNVKDIRDMLLKFTNTAEKVEKRTKTM